MFRLVWATDLHLNFVSASEVVEFCRSIKESNPDAVLIGGDIAEAPDVESYLLSLQNLLQVPICFVLGNHDFYRGSIHAVRSAVAALCSQSQWLHWLPLESPIKLTEEAALVGHDSWADGRLGDGARSQMLLNDFFMIDEFAGLTTVERFDLLHRLGDETAAFFRSILPGAFKQFRRIILLTHVPPFRESCWHEGQISDDEALPHFSCKAVGDALMEIMRALPDRELTVLCGHTHGSGEARILPNLRVLTGGAQYGNPKIQQILTLK